VPKLEEDLLANKVTVHGDLPAIRDNFIIIKTKGIRISSTRLDSRTQALDLLTRLGHLSHRRLLNHQCTITSQDQVRNFSPDITTNSSSNSNQALSHDRLLRTDSSISPVPIKVKDEDVYFLKMVKI
jgi:hypothetical protein